LDFEEMLNSDGKRLKDVLKKSGEFDDESDEEEDYYGKRYGAKKEVDEDITLPMATGVQDQPRKGSKVVGAANASKPASDLSGSKSMDIDPTVRSTPPPSTTIGKLNPNTILSKEYSLPSGAGHPSSRAASPAAPSGAALVAMRATSPKRPHLPLSRATSPTGGRALSPLAGDGNRGGLSLSAAIAPANAATVDAKKAKDVHHKSHLHPASPVPAQNPPTSSSNGGVVKKIKTGNSTAQSTIPIPTQGEVIQFIRSSGGRVSAKDLAVRFKTKDSKDVKVTLINLVKQVGKMEAGEDKAQYVTLKPGYA